MSKYAPLGQFLKSQTTQEVRMTFAEIEGKIGCKLPPSAYNHRPWWSNNPSNNVMTKVWLDAGYRTEQVDMEGKKLVFRHFDFGDMERAVNEVLAPMMAEEAREFEPSQSAGEKKQNRHPALGAMRGTFTIEPGYDLTRPMYTDEEWAEIEKEMSEDWDQIEQGMSGGNK